MIDLSKLVPGNHYVCQMHEGDEIVVLPYHGHGMFGCRKSDQDVKEILKTVELPSKLSGPEQFKQNIYNLPLYKKCHEAMQACLLEGKRSYPYPVKLSDTKNHLSDDIIMALLNDLSMAGWYCCVVKTDFRHDGCKYLGLTFHWGEYKYNLKGNQNIYKCINKLPNE